MIVPTYPIKLTSIMKGFISFTTWLKIEKFL